MVGTSHARFPRLVQVVESLIFGNSKLNCYAERFVKSVKSECLDHLILSSVKHLEYVIQQYCTVSIIIMNVSINC
jgi:hypothetical protein